MNNPLILLYLLEREGAEQRLQHFMNAILASFKLLVLAACCRILCKCLISKAW